MLDINDLINAFTMLPGIGKKSATRITYHLLKQKDIAIGLSDTIEKVISNITTCSTCGNFTAKDPCSFCRSSDRDDSILCIVEEPRDLYAIEETGNYKGRYHILMGSINPLEGVGPEKIRLKELVVRIEENKFSEILVATNPTTEGEATFLYISRLLSKYEIKISRLATGIPMGGSLEYADRLTLSKAIQSKYYV